MLDSWICSMNYILMAILRHIPSKHLRIFILRRMGGVISSNVSMFASVDIRKPRGIIIEEGCSIGPHVLLDGRSGLKIRRNATIAYGALIWTVHHDKDAIDFKTVGERVEIGEYAWVCSRSIILPGVRVGNYAVVASGAVVTKDVDDYAIVAGIPAKKIGERKKQNYNYTPYMKGHIY